MSIGLIGRKVGVTQVFQGDGTMVAVSVLAIEPNTVTRLRTDERDGYTAVQLGTDSAKKLTKPEAGQLKDLPKGSQSLATIREFRVDSVDGYEVGQKLALGDLFADGDLVDVTGVSKGKGFAGHIKRHHFHRGPKSHGSDHHREPGSIGPGTTPGRVYQRPEDGRPHGRRPGHDQEGPRRPRRHRPQPAARQGVAARRPRRADPREEGLTMPNAPLYDRTGKSLGSVELADVLFAAPVNAAVLHQVVTAQLAGRRLGHARHEDPRRGPRRRRQAVPPEGHRPRPPGLEVRAPLQGRRRRLRAAPALLRAAAAAQDEAPRAPRRADREARRRGREGHRHVRAGRDQDPRPGRRARRARGQRSRARGRPRPRREARAVGAQPADGSR